MSADWVALSRSAGLSVDGDTIRSDLHNERHQLVHVGEDHGDLLRVWSIVARPAIVDGLDDVALRAWRRNRLSELVGFRLDVRRRLIGEAWVPTAGVTADEWAFTVRYVAKICDGFEYTLTGRDVE